MIHALVSALKCPGVSAAVLAVGIGVAYIPRGRIDPEAIEAANRRPVPLCPVESRGFRFPEPGDYPLRDRPWIKSRQDHIAWLTRGEDPEVVRRYCEGPEEELIEYLARLWPRMSSRFWEIIPSREKPYGTLDAMLEAELGITRDEGRKAISARERSREAAEKSDGKTLPRGRPTLEDGNQIGKLPIKPQPERAASNGIGLRTQSKLDRLARDFPEQHARDIRTSARRTLIGSQPVAIRSSNHPGRSIENRPSPSGRQRRGRPLEGSRSTAPRSPGTRSSRSTGAEPRSRW